MAYKVRRSVACRQDLDSLFDHLLQSYQDLGETAGEAFERAAARMNNLEDRIDALGKTPHQGTLWPEVMDGLRWTTKDHAILYFIARDTERAVDVLAVFFSGQNHRAHILKRITANT